MLIPPFLYFYIMFRNIILVRHGHYNLDGKDDKERYLTALGLEQAKITGARLGKIWKDISLLWVRTDQDNRS